MLVAVVNTAAVGGSTAIRKSMIRLESTDAGAAGASDVVRLVASSMRSRNLLSAARKLSSSVPKCSMPATTTKAPRIAAQTTRWPTGYHSIPSGAPSTGRAKSVR